MAFRKLVWLPVVLAGVLGLASAVTAGEEGTKAPADKPAGQMGMDEMMQQWAKMNQLGPEHAEFKKAAGTWKHVSKMWMGPGEPTVSEGTAERTLVFGGRYLQEHYRCNSPDMPFEGVALTGYDTMKKKYVTIWYDSMSTGIMIREGDYDPATKTTTTYSAEYDDPFMGTGKMKNAIKTVSDDEQVMESYWIGKDGHETKTMEIRYTRM
jgi:hypothetical protein